MRKLNYYIAVTADGFISHEDGSITGLLMEGDHADAFIQSLSGYDTVLMGRKTYEFGFQFGLQPGQAAYPNLHHYVFSKSLCFESSEQVTLVSSNVVETVQALKQGRGKDIWLCGGGDLAGDLLEHGLIDSLTVKVNPVIFGAGRTLFGARAKAVELSLVSSKTYDNGVQLNTYDIVND